MRVRIGKYKSWFGPYQLADLLRFVGVSKDRCHEIGHKIPSGPFLLLDKARRRKFKVRIDPWDTWSLYSDLGGIILPALKEFRSKVNGTPWVHNEDLPPSLRGSTAPEDNGYNFEGWKYILDEMIWAFENLDEDDPPEGGPSHRIWSERRREGLRLFGKYYMALWN